VLPPRSTRLSLPVERRISGHRVLHLASATSTSEVARAGLQRGELVAGDVVLADEQTAGRGRRGRGWVTVPGRSLAASVVLAPPAALSRPSRLVVLAAVSACRALEACGARDLRIKWPNDLMRGDRKLGGLLAETVTGAAASALVVLGVGLNLRLRPGDLPHGLADTAGDAGLREGPETRDAVLAALLGELDAALAQAGTPADAERGEEYRRRSWLTGRQVELRAGGAVLSTRLADVTADGDLVLPDGRRLPGESVELLAVAPR
jgi:BirA family biotin operon repressor/biotin-[acetyl-CoA-carboxylase] ligase